MSKRPHLERELAKLKGFQRRTADYAFERLYLKKHVSKADRHDQSQFLGDMRNLLAATCIEALEPDLVILDEFQRFRYLLQPNDEAGAEI